jgi:branched-chain amino acid transport system permease protein
LGAASYSMVASARTNSILIEVVVFAMVAVSLTVLMGYSGQISLGHWGLAGVGAFALGNLWVRMHLPFLLALPLTFLVGMAVSLLIGLPALRIRGPYLAVVTLAFSLAAEFFIFRSQLVGASTSGIPFVPPQIGPVDLNDPTGRPMFFFSVAVLLLMMLLARNLARSRTGRAFFSLRENEKAAATLGVHLTRYRLMAFGVSGGIASLAGAIYGLSLGRAYALDWSTATSLVLVAVVMIGGLGSMSGAVLGALLVIGVPRLVQFDNPWIVPIGTGTLLILVIVRMRGGLGGMVQAIREDLVKSFDLLANPSAHPRPPERSGPPKPQRTKDAAV